MSDQKAGGERPVKFRNLIFYGMGDFYGGGSFLVIGMLFMFFLTEYVGLNPMLAGLVFGIGKIWDGISDPLMGYISDRTHTKVGRRRIYFLIGIIPIFLTFSMLWVNIKSSNEMVLFAYYSMAYLLFNTVFTMVLVPYSALNAEMTTNYKVRSRLSAARMIFSQSSALLAGVIPKIIIANTATASGAPDPIRGHFIMGTIFAVGYALVWIPVFFGTWELPYKRVTDRSNALGIFKQFGSIFKNKSFRIHILMYICAYSALDVLMALFAYYLTYYLGREGLYPIVMGTVMITQIGMLSVYVMISNKMGKGFAYRMGLILWALGLTIYLILPRDAALPMLVLASVVLGAGQSAGVLIPWAILPTVADVDQLITGKKRAGSYAGAMTLIRKIVQGLIAMPLVGFMIGMLGFGREAAAVAEPNVQGLRLFFMLGPVVFIVIGALISTFFKVTPSTHKEMMGEIKRLKEGGSPSDVTPETRSVCETLTGMPYETLGLVKDPGSLAREEAEEK